MPGSLARSLLCDRGSRARQAVGEAVQRRARHLPPGRYGVRIEDIVACTETGAERFHDAPSGLVVLPR
jgi:Xaa-Pro aminopeptidase